MRPTTEVAAEAESWVLTTDRGRALLGQVAATANPGPADFSRWRREASPDLVSAAIRPVETRRRAAAKFSRADRMWLEPTALEQATSEVVAHHKAQRFAGNRAVDLCCGIGGDAIALAIVCPTVAAVDRDRGMVLRAQWNARAYDVAERLTAVLGRAESFPIPSNSRVHVDPDRRAGGSGRAMSLAGYAPGIDILRTLSRQARGGAIKLGPASDFGAHFDDPAFEIELVSLAGECKEATVWFGDLPTCRRRATALPSGTSWTNRDGDPRSSAGVVPLSDRVFDPDPALIRSGLLDSFASARGLNRIVAGIDLLTGPSAINSPFVAEFEVLDVLPLDLKRLRREVSARGLGTLEIKPRGIAVPPETLRGQLRLEGPETATIFPLGGEGKRRVILARRVGRSSESGILLE